MAYLTITNPSLKTGEVLYFSWGGFNAAAQVWVGVVGGGGNWFNGTGGSSGFQLGEAPGNYTLEAYDDIGMYYVTAPFTITAAQSAGWKPMLPSFFNSGLLSYGLPEPTSSSSTIPANAQPGASVQVVGYIGVGNVATLVRVTGTYGSSPLTFSPAQSTIQNGTQSFVANFTMPATDTVVTLTFQYWNGTAWVIFDQDIATVIVPQSVGWHPMLPSYVTSGQLTYTAPQSVGWHAMLTALVASGQLAFTAPQSMGWFPMLTAIVASSQLNFTAPQSQGWHPMLTAMVASEMLKYAAPPSEGWMPMLDQFVTSPTLRIPGAPPEEGGTSPWVWALVAGAAGLALASTSKGNKPVPGSRQPVKGIDNKGEMR